MKERLQKDEIKRLHSPQRIARLEIERVVELCLEKLFVTKILNIGSGTGLFSEAFSLRNLEVTGLDINPAMVNAAQSNVNNATFRVGSAEMLPFPDKSFDLIFINDILPESVTPQKILNEARRVAKYRIAILEWPYRQEDIGPPLDYRISPETVKKISHRAGCIQLEKIDLTFMIFYRMTPK